MEKPPGGHCWAGTSGIVLPVPNKAAYPAHFRDQPRLSYYASLFNSLEINSSFYRVPMAATFAKWADCVPEGFRFTVKLDRAVSHVKNLQFQEADVDNFMKAADRLGSKKGCLLIQLPPGLQATGANKIQLQKLLQRICLSDPSHSWRLAVEFRHSSWYMGDTFELLDAYWASIVLQDMRASAIDVPNENGFVYLRFHGPAGDYKGNYPKEFLNTYGDKIKGWLALGKDVYVYFNNTIGGASADLLYLLGLIGVHKR